MKGHIWETNALGEPVTYDGLEDFHDILLHCTRCEMFFCQSCVESIPDVIDDCDPG